MGIRCAATSRVPRCRGFTLIELLVVIAIIALLVSILLPSLKQARELTRQSVCMAHLRGAVSAVHLYASDNDGDIVPLFWARKKSGWPGPPDYPGWADAYFSDKQLLGPYTSNDQIFGRCRPGSLWHCPSDKGFRENRTSDKGSYGLCTKSYPWISKSKGWSRMWKLSRVRSGSKMLAFLDSTIPRFNPGYGKSPAFHGNIEPLPKNRPNKWRAGKPGCNYNHSMRHVNLTTNCSFIDGHVAKLDDLKESFDAGQFVIDHEER